MPVAAWIDERHLPPLGLTNAWGYNPVTFMALDPRLAPGGIAELRETVAALRDAGIGVILDLVFNHTGESDELGPTLSLRGLDNRAYYRHDPDNPGRSINDTGTGNTLACDRSAGDRSSSSMRCAISCSMPASTVSASILPPVLGRVGQRLRSRRAACCRRSPAIRCSADRILIAEPWDIGPGGYQLGNFPPPFLEWNDHYRDDVRRFWRGDRGMIGALATRLAGSSDIFRKDGQATTRSVNFIAAHDGFTLADLVGYERKHNEANGEQNRDGHNENLSWNNGVEGETADAGDHRRARSAIVRAMLSTLFASRGTIMLTAGDEFGRTQHGNNNAYAQDNEITWLDWAGPRPRARGSCRGARRVPQALARAWRDTGFLDGKLLPGGVDGCRMAVRERPAARRARMAAARPPSPDHGAGRRPTATADRHRRQRRPPRRRFHACRRAPASAGCRRRAPSATSAGSSTMARC